MNRSHLDKLSESYAQIAEGKKSEEEVKDWNRKDDNPQGKKVDKKKVDKCTCESFYLKRLHAMNPVYAEQYRAIAEVLIGEGYESARLLDNIIEALPMDVVGPEFMSAMKAVNPRINENLETAEKKQARAIVLEQIRMKSWDEWKRGIKNIPGNLQRAGQAVSDFINPPASKSADPVVRQGGSYTGPSGTAVTGPTPEQRAEKLRQQRQETQDALRGTTGTAQTGERSAAANDAKQQAAKAQAQAARTGGTSGSTGGTGSTGSAYAPPSRPAAAPRPTTNKDGSSVTRVGTNNAGQTPMQQWAKNFPSLAAKVKPGQSGYKEISAMKPKTVSASYQPEGEQIDEFFGPKTVTPKDSPSGTKSVEVGKKYPARQNGRPVDVTYDKQGNKSTKPMSRARAGVMQYKHGSTWGLNLNNSHEPEGEMTESTKSVFESLKQARKNVGASTCWDGYKAKGTKTKNGKEVPNCVKEEEQLNERPYQVYGYDEEGKKEKKVGKPVKSKKYANARAAELEDTHKKKGGRYRSEYVDEGVRDVDAEKGTKERKERLEKKRGHKVDDHPQFKKDKKDDSYLETNMKKRQENNEKARKEMASQKDDTVPRWMKDDFNLYDAILTYLDENEIMESVEHAEEIMEQLTAEEILGIVEEVLGEADERPENRNSPAHRDRSNEGLSDRQIRMKQFADKRVQQANQRTADTQAARARSARTSRGSRGGRGGGGFSSLDTATYGLGQFDPSRHGGV